MLHFFLMVLGVFINYNFYQKMVFINYSVWKFYVSYDVEVKGIKTITVKFS